MDSIVMIPVGELYHHPENPRLELGDLTELAESIKANGVMQNLTVVKGHRMSKEEWIAEARAEGADRLSAEACWDPEAAWVSGGYTVVIGNRRMEAAKAAGLEAVPCVISGMDRRTQISTMLTENMQRQDLTVYEQAQGFQMMMDLGYSAKEIGEKTGFSEKTVKDRIRFTKFNRKNFSEAVARGATLADMIEISKLTSKADQNEVMKEAGTNNFRLALKRKLGEQKFKEGCEAMKKTAAQAGDGAYAPVPDGMNTWEKCDRIDSVEHGESEEKILRKLKKLAKENGSLMYRFRQQWDTNEAVMDVYRLKKEKTAEEESEEEKARKDAERARQKRVRETKKLWAEAYALRTDFIRNYTVTNGTGMTSISRLILKYALTQQNSWNHKLPENQHWKEKYIKDTLGIRQEEYEDKKSVYELAEARGIPQIRTMLAWMMGGGVFDTDSPEYGLYYYHDGSYMANGSGMMQERYAFLKEIGYVMSDMEEQLMDGTHPVYGAKEEA